MSPGDLADFLAAFTFAALIIFAIETGLAFLRMLWRLGTFLFAHEKVPILLWRDIVLFGSFSIYWGAVLILRLAGAQLTQNPFWIVPTTVLILTAMGFWVWVEYHLDE